MAIEIVKQDEYGTVMNHQTTYEGLAKILNIAGHVVFAWTDGHSTQEDILISLGPIQFGLLQRGMKNSNSLFVAVSGFGMFGFALNKTEKYPSYVAEKLGMGGVNPTTSELAALINGICTELERPEPPAKAVVKVKK